MIPAPFRFKGHNSLRYVYANGKAVRSQPLTVKWVKNTHRSKPRISVVVSKKVIKGAVGRNRIRRRLYEYVRLNLPRLNDTYDIVIICTSAELRTIPTADLKDQLDQLFLKADLYKTP
jgi:ribonuclease P protein component